MKLQYLLTLLLSVTLVGCTKDKKVLYEVKESTIKNTNSPKTKAKTTIEFISIAYQDVMGTTISQQKLSALSVAYTAFGDKKTIEDMIVKNLLNEPATTIPTKTSMNADPEKFVDETIKKILNRDAGAYEKYYFTKLINDNNTVTPTMIYYALMTSEEYRYY